MNNRDEDTLNLMRNLKSICFFDQHGNDISDQFIGFKLSLEKNEIRYTFSPVRGDL